MKNETSKLDTFLDSLNEAMDYLIVVQLIALAIKVALPLFLIIIIILLLM